jgi:hypothetical protein
MCGIRMTVLPTEDAADNAGIVARVRRQPLTSRQVTMSLPAAFRSSTALRRWWVFPDGMRGNGDGHRPGWPGALNGT